MAIPKGKKGVDGSFYPQSEVDYLHQGKEILRTILASSTMLLVGEDLGNVPHQVKCCLQKLGICGTKVLRWERKWEGDHSFIPNIEFNADSMTTVSIHDSETLSEWWSNQLQEVTAFCDAYGITQKNPEHSIMTPNQREQILRASFRTPSLFHINLLSEYLPLAPSLNFSESSARINTPGTKGCTNWSFRIGPSIEEIAANSELSSALQKLNKRTYIVNRERRSVEDLLKLINPK